eukprot:403345264
MRYFDDARNMRNGMQNQPGIIQSGTATRRNAKLKYIFEEKHRNGNRYNGDEEEEAREPAKFYGYQDETFTAGASGNSCYAIMIYDAQKNVFQIAPVDKHFKFEKQIEIKKKKTGGEFIDPNSHLNTANTTAQGGMSYSGMILDTNNHTPSEEELKRQAALIRKENKRKALQKVLTDHKKAVLMQSKFESERFENEVKVKDLDEMQNMDPKEKAKLLKKKKKKGLTEKQLDFEEIFDDDNEEDVFGESDNIDDEEEEENLSEEGKQLKTAIKEQEKNAPEGGQNPLFNNNRLNLNFQVEEEDNEEVKDDSKADGNDSDSSLDPALQEDQDDDDSNDQNSVGGKRSVGQSSLREYVGDKKRTKY